MSRYREHGADCTVYVGNLDREATKSDLHTAFGRFGPLRNVWIAYNPPGFAFVHFVDPRDAEDSVIALNGAVICGSHIRVGLSSGRPRRGRHVGQESVGYPHPPLNPHFRPRHFSPHHRPRSPRPRDQFPRRIYECPNCRYVMRSRSPLRYNSRSYSRSPRRHQNNNSRTPSRSPRRHFTPAPSRNAKKHHNSKKSSPSKKPRDEDKSPRKKRDKSPSKSSRKSVDKTSPERASRDRSKSPSSDSRSSSKSSRRSESRSRV